MANRWLVQKLIANAKRRGWLVQSDDSTEGFTEEDFCEVIDEVARSKLVPLLMSVRESYLTKRYDMDLDGTTDRYALPRRAAAESLRSILYESNGEWLQVDRTEPESANQGMRSSPFAFYLDDDAAVFYPVPAAQTVRVLVHNRPSMVVPAEAVGCVSDFDAETGEVTILQWDEDDEDFASASGVPTGFTETALYDFVKGEPGFRCHAVDQLVTDVTGNVLTFAEVLPDSLEVGDFVCLAGESPIAQVPAELHPLLAQEVTRTILESRGDAKADRAERTAAKLEEQARMMLSSRTSETPKYIHNKNAPGWKRGLLRWRGYS